jgi:hypothetical protein
VEGVDENLHLLSILVCGVLSSVLKDFLLCQLFVSLPLDVHEVVSDFIHAHDRDIYILVGVDDVILEGSEESAFSHSWNANWDDSDNSFFGFTEIRPRLGE